MFTVLATGDWSIDQVHVRRSGAKRRLVPEVEAAIDVAWQTLAARPGVKLFDGAMLRLASFQATPKQLDLEVGETSYKPFVGTNLANPQFTDQYGHDVMADPLGLAPVLVTSDGYLLMGRRQASLATYPGRIHPFAGTMEPKDSGPFQAVRRELREELSLQSNDIADVRCIGLVEEGKLLQPELIFTAYSLLTRDALVAKLDDDEHHDAWSIPADAETVAEALETEVLLTPIACSALLLWGRLKFGHLWFEDHYDIARR